MNQAGKQWHCNDNYDTIGNRTLHVSLNVTLNVQMSCLPRFLFGMIETIQQLYLPLLVDINNSSLPWFDKVNALKSFSSLEIGQAQKLLTQAFTAAVVKVKLAKNQTIKWRMLCGKRTFCHPLHLFMRISFWYKTKKNHNDSSLKHE